MNKAKFQIGDVVRVLSFSELSDRFLPGTKRMPSGCYFADPMSRYCDKEFTLVKVEEDFRGVCYCKLKGIPNWWFTDEMLEIAEEPVAIVLDSEISFDDVVGGSYDN